LLDGPAAPIALAGITASTPDPAGGHIRRKEGSNEPTGVLEETAHVTAEGKVVPKLGGEEVLALIEAGQKEECAGYPTMSDEEATAAVSGAFANDRQILVHTNGDAAIDPYVKAVRLASAKHGNPIRRPVVIHGQPMREDPIEAIREPGMFPSFFPMHTFCWGDGHRDSVLGPEHRVEPIVTLKAMTLWGAYQHFEEKTKGSIEVGKLADFAILSENPLTIDRARLADIQVVEIIKKGKTIYRLDPAAKKAAGGCARRRLSLAYSSRRPAAMAPTSSAPWPWAMASSSRAASAGSMQSGAPAAASIMSRRSLRAMTISKPGWNFPTAMLFPRRSMVAVGLKREKSPWASSARTPTCLASWYTSASPPTMVRIIALPKSL